MSQLSKVQVLLSIGVMIMVILLLNADPNGKLHATPPIGTPLQLPWITPSTTPAPTGIPEGYEFVPGITQPEPFYQNTFFLFGNWVRIFPLKEDEWVVVQGGDGTVYAPSGDYMLGQGKKCFVLSVKGPTTREITFLGLFNFVYTQGSTDPISSLVPYETYVGRAIDNLLEQPRCADGVDHLSFPAE